ncbi:MAG: Ig-like domain repeat protein [Chloroflexi bacterium]|nr:Ig-like domain repeat protein [Chloroflexota bacterium]
MNQVDIGLSLLRRLAIAAIGGSLMAALLMWAAATPSLALPAYVPKTGQTCGACHLNPNGGGDLNARGQAFASITTHSSDPATAWAQASAAPAAAPAAPAAVAQAVPQSVAASASGAATSLTVLPSASETTGASVKLTASLKDASGSPVAKATVRFYADAEFAKVKDQMEIGAARTDANGVATVSYTPRAVGNERITARFDGSGPHGAAEGSFQLEVRGAEPAYTVAPRGLEAITDLAPVGLFLALLGAWGTFAYVLYQVYRIRQEGKGSPYGR